MLNNDSVYVLVSGSSSGVPRKLVYEKLDELLKSLDSKLSPVIVHTNCQGVDSYAESYCRQNSIQTKIITPLWHIYGRSAWYVNNQKEVDYVKNKAHGYAICFIKNNSRGTLDTINKCKVAGIPVTVIKVE